MVWILIKILQPVAAILLLSVSLPAAAQRDQIADLPATLKVKEVVAEGSDIFSDCWSTVFALDQQLALRLQRDGANALVGAQHPRGTDVWGYAPFAPTPVDVESRESWNINGYVWASLGCGLSPRWRAASEEIATRPGGIYAFGRSVLILIDPKRSVLILLRHN